MKKIAQLLLITLAPLIHAQNWEAITPVSHDEDAFTDGDSIPIITENETFIINLYFIDAPETNDRYADKINEQATYWGRTVEETIAAGKAAGEFVSNNIAEGFVVQTRRAKIGGGGDPRFYGMIKVGDRYLSELLVEAGLARVKGKTHELADGTSAAAFLDKLRALEREASTAKVGAWGDGEIDTEPLIQIIVPGDEPAEPIGVITIESPVTAYKDDGTFAELGTLKSGHKIKVVDTEPYLRVLIAVPGKKPIPALIKQSDLK